MNFFERVHNRYVHKRRVETVSRHIAEMLPKAASVLDVGCGDGRIAHRIQEIRPDVSIKGIDVLVRPNAEIAVTQFDGKTIPLENGSVDVVAFIDVLHHTSDPTALLREAKRVASAAIIVKDHMLEGFLAGPILRFMDRIGNRRHGVALPHNYWRREQWNRAWSELAVYPEIFKTRLGLYPPPANWVFERSLHFVALLRRAISSQTEREFRSCTDSMDLSSSAKATIS